MKRRQRSSPFSLFSFQDIITGLCGVLVLFVLIMIVDLVSRRSSSPDTPESAPVLQDVRTDAAVIAKEIETLRDRLAELRKQLAERRVETESGVSDERLEEAEREMDEKERMVAALLSQVNALETKLEKARNADAESKRILQEMEKTRRDLENGLAEMKSRNGITLIPERGNLKSPVYVVLSGKTVEIYRPLDRNAPADTFPVNDTFLSTLGRRLSTLDTSTHSVVLLVRPSGAWLMDRAAEKVRNLGFACGRDPLEEDVEIAFSKVDMP